MPLYTFSWLWMLCSGLTTALCLFPTDGYSLNVKCRYILGIMEKLTMCSLLEGVYEFLSTMFVAGFTSKFVSVNQVLI